MEAMHNMILAKLFNKLLTMSYKLNFQDCWAGFCLTEVMI